MNIQKGIDNTVVLTLSEKSTLLSPEYLIEFTNDMTGDKTSKVVAISDISDYVESYNKFIITESNTEDLQNSIVSLSPVGKWSYIVYEMESSSPRNMNTADAIGIVETGICEVEGIEISKSVFDEEETKNNGVFDEE
jgi:hypothetical protein